MVDKERPMETVVRIHDRHLLERFIRPSRFLNVFLLADLDNRYWKQTAWYGLMKDRSLRALALLFGKTPPLFVLLAPRRRLPAARRLLRELRNDLPANFHADLAPGLKRLLEGKFLVRRGGEGPHLRMGLVDWHPVRRTDITGTVRMNTRDVPALRRLYREGYPGNYFSPEHLGNGHFFGIRAEGRLISAGGLLAFSRRYRVAALGDFATHPAFRRRGLATRVLAAVCRSLRGHADTIGLCVKAGNTPAIGCYRRMGFRPFGTTEILRIRRRPGR